jgi:hypothetical protein
VDFQNREVFVEKKSITLSEFKTMWDEGDIELNPDYQRDYVYTEKRASKLVESILMGIPIPTVYLSQEQNETYSVIDGQQRLTSFVKYLSNEYKLKDLQELTELNDLYFKDLDKEVQRKLKKCSLETIIILKNSSELKYEIFARLNQGAVSLKPQELRNCIYRGSFNNMIEDIAKTNKTFEILMAQENKRKTYQEQILRFFALRDFSGFKSSLLKTMNGYMASHQNDDADSIAKQKQLFNGTIDIIKQVLGNDAFFGYDRNKGIMISKFSGSIFDSIVVPFSMFNKHDIMQNADKIRNEINELKKNNEEYKDYTYAATGSKKRVIGRIMLVMNVLKKYLDSSSIGEQRTFTEDDKKALFKPGYICSYCGNEILSIEDAEVDHITPFSLGGKTVLENAQLLHRHCNREKSDSLDKEWEEEDTTL